ncbi:MAG TPA: DNA internalization-related competence protein ComEC/Rec2 [Candidatus Angelobacter sp.]|nr:DNA internalization-related competence protein ComEC/Rec2 [Candidatus Angelobacter sp.]
MRLPAVAIAAAFASGIALGLHPAAVRNASSLLLLCSGGIASLFLILGGVILAKWNRLLWSTSASLTCWVLLGFLGACVEEQPRAGNHVTSLIDRGQLSLQTPLRWHGHLRDEPAKLPWGYGLELELSSVEFEGVVHPAVGGLRLNFVPHSDSFLLPELHAGDNVEVLAEARRPQVFRDEGVFDRRAYLAQQNIDLIGTLRAQQLITRVSSPSSTPATLLARVRRRFREEIDELCVGAPQAAGVLRAMLLGDRSFVDRAESTDFQKTGAFHVLVVAGLHVGAIAFVLFWLARKLRISRVLTMVSTLVLLLAYVAVVEQRAPVLRAAIMAAIVVLSGFFFRRLELLNSAALAALVILVAKPLSLRDPGFQLTFVAIGCIAGLAAPWLETTVQPYLRALRGWRDVTRDAAHEPRAVQFRMDLRAMANGISARMPGSLGRVTGNAISGGLTLTFRVWELSVVTVVLQIGMLPLMARDFHRVALAAPIVNLAAVPMIGILVPFGFVTLLAVLILHSVGKLLAAPLVWCTSLLVHIVEWFARFPPWSYRIPGPPLWLAVLFFLAGVLLASAMRLKRAARRGVILTACLASALSALTIAAYPFSPEWAKGRLEVSVLDVGQGDSLFIVSPRGKTMLIDGGGAFGGYIEQKETFGLDPGEEAVSPYLWSRGFQKLDVVALTHAHQDHLGGLIAILENFSVRELWIGREVSSPALRQLEELAKTRSVVIEHELRGRSFDWDGVHAEFLWPEPEHDVIASVAKNDDSLVLKLRYRNENILLPGDAERQAEHQILTENGAVDLHSDVLKVGHHGGKNSTTPEFLAAVQPRVGIISVGENNSYGHPSPELLERLESAGVRILRTDRDGAVHMLTDGQRVEITCFQACTESLVTTASVQTKAPDHNQGPQQQ